MPDFDLNDLRNELDDAKAQIKSLEDQAKSSARNIDTAFQAIKIASVFKAAETSFKVLSATVELTRGNMKGFVAAAEQIPLGIGKAVKAAKELYDVINLTKERENAYNLILARRASIYDQINSRARESSRMTLSSQLENISAQSQLTAFAGFTPTNSVDQTSRERARRGITANLADEQSSAVKLSVQEASDKAAENSERIRKSQEETDKFKRDNNIQWLLDRDPSTNPFLGFHDENTKGQRTGSVSSGPALSSAEKAMLSSYKELLAGTEALRREPDSDAPGIAERLSNRQKTSQSRADLARQQLDYDEQQQLKGESLSRSNMALDAESNRRSLKSNLISSRGNFSNSFENRFGLMELGKEGSSADNNRTIDERIRKLSEMIQTPAVAGLIRAAQEDRSNNADLIGDTFKGEKSQLIREAKNRRDDMMSSMIDKRPATQNELRFGIMINTNDIPKQQLDELKDLNKFLKAMAP